MSYSTRVCCEHQTVLGLLEGFTIFSKLLTRFKAAWLRSTLRTQCLTFKHLRLPLLLGNKPTVEVYLALNDPYSFMLMQVLADIEQRYTICFKLYLIYDALPGVTIAPKLMRAWALKDANFIAEQYGLKKLQQYPSSKTLITGQQMWQFNSKSIAEALSVFYRTWFDGFEHNYNNSTPVINFQIKNLQRLSGKGHYLPASLFFAGDWFVGIDRLAYLEEKLQTLGLTRGEQRVKYTHNRLMLNGDKPLVVLGDSSAFDVYLSLRSPYSYLGFVKAKRLAEHYHLTLNIKPILPLMMRGLDVPVNKQRYLYIDAHREAKSANIPFQSFADPLGQGIINCYQVFSYAKSQGQEVAFIDAVFKAIYVDNIDVSLPRSIDKICQNIGLNYQQAMAFALDHDWQQWIDQYQTELEALGLWGVPCFKYQDIFCWGQDRLTLIEQTILSSNNPKLNIG